jgi:AcrR family transcriptional regulator
MSEPALAVEQGKRAQNRTRRRAQVIEAASALAAAGGYDAVQMRDVADRAGVALGTLYRYFPSKDQLLVATLVESASELRDRLSQKPPRGDTAADRIVDILRRANRYLEREPRLTAAMVAALSSPDPDTTATKHEAFAVLHDIISTALTDGDDEQRHAVIRALGNVWFAVLIQWTVGMADAAQMAHDLETATRLLARGWNGDR